jgi:hypothetical protein
MSYAEALVGRSNVNAHDNNEIDEESVKAARRLRRILGRYDMIARVVYSTNEARRAIKKANGGVIPSGTRGVVWNMTSDCDRKERGFIVDAYLCLSRQAYKVNSASMINLNAHEELYDDDEKVPTKNEMVEAMVDYIPPELVNCDWGHPIMVLWE